MKRSHQASPCQHVEIAHSNVGEVMICADCNVVHISLQHMSLRFEVEAFRSLAYMLGNAQMKINHLNQTMQMHREHPDSMNIDLLHPEKKAH
jgi:hypothetical protein